VIRSSHRRSTGVLPLRATVASTRSAAGTVLRALAQASGQPASVVTLVLTGLSDWYEAHASGVVVKEGIWGEPDPGGNGDLPPPPENPPS